MTILGIAPPAGLKPITDDRVRGRLLQLFARAQLGWETTAKREIADPTGPGGRPIPFVYRASKRPSFGTPSSSSGAAGSEKAAFAMIEEALREYRAHAAARSANNGP